MFHNIKQLQQAKLIISAIKKYGGEIRFIGGCVRDALSKRKIKDIDLATTLLPYQVEEALNNAKIKNIPTGKQFGTISAIINKTAYEITTLRLDLKTDGRKAEVKYTNDWQQDALRRDFTFNALSYDIDEDKLYDYFNGQEDLNSGIVRFVGEPEKRVQEDYLRIIRYYRFFGIFGKKIDQSSVYACKKFANKISNLSAERKLNEFIKIFKTEHWFKTVSALYEDNILIDYIGNNPSKNEITIIKNLHSLKLQINPILALAILSSYKAKPVSEILKLSKKQFNYLDNLINCFHQMEIQSNEKHLIYKFEKEIYFDSLKIIAARNKDYNLFDMQFNRYKDWQIPVFPISGSDLKKLGFKEGKSLGNHLRELEESWIKSDFKLTKEQLLEIIKTTL